MKRTLSEADRNPEEFLAELTDAAYRVALRHGLKGSFVDVELELWGALRQAIHAYATARDRDGRVQSFPARRHLDEIQEAALCPIGEAQSWQA